MESQSFEVQTFDNSVVGPFSGPHIVSAFVTGKLSLDTRVRLSGHTGWRPLYWYFHLLLGVEPATQQVPSSHTQPPQITAPESHDGAPQQPSVPVHLENGVLGSSAQSDSSRDEQEPAVQPARPAAGGEMQDGPAREAGGSPAAGREAGATAEEGGQADGVGDAGRVS